MINSCCHANIYLNGSSCKNTFKSDFWMKSDVR